MDSKERFGQNKRVPVLTCMNVYIDTYCVLKCTSGKKQLLHLAHGPLLKA